MELNKKELNILQIFYDKSLELKNSSIFKNGMTKTKFEIKYDIAKGVVIKTEGPEIEALKSLTTTIRQFYMKNELIYFPKVLLIIQNTIEPDKELSKKLNSASNAYNRILSKTPIKLQLGDKVLKPKDIIDFWFYGHIFHSDLEKVNRFNRISKTMMFPILKNEFKSLMLQLSKLFILTGELIQLNILIKQSKE